MFLCIYSGKNYFFMQWTSKLKTSHTWGKYHVENPLKCFEKFLFGRMSNKRMIGQEYGKQS